MSRGTIQEVHLLTNRADFTEFFQYVLSSGSGLNRMEAGMGKMSPVCCIVVLSLALQLSVCHKQVINVIPPMGKGSLTSDAE